MTEITFEINSNSEIWELFDKEFDHVFLHNFMPNEVIEWWETDLKTNNGIKFKNLSVRQMKMDIQTDLKELKQILELNTNYLSIYQFDRPISDTLELERLPEEAKDKILKQNGLKHWFWVNFEFITIGSFDDSFIESIELNPLFAERIKKRKQSLTIAKNHKMRKLIYIGILGLIISCSTTQTAVKTNLKNSQTFEITEISTDPTYGLSQKNPIQVGGVDKNEGPLNERRFLNALAGPKGEEVTYFRAGSCCPIKSKNDPFGYGSVLLDNYQVTWSGSQDTVSVYINMYDYGTLKAPVGFTIKK